MLWLMLLVLLCSLVHQCIAWNEWNYTITWSSVSEEDAVIKATVWNRTWFNKYYNGDDSPPRPRKGHSLHIIKTDERSEYAGATYIVMFGGRDNDQRTEHIPKTYNVENINGSVQFTTYDQKPVSACNDPQNLYFNPSEQTNCNFTTSSIVNVGVLYNDVWAYRLCNQSANERDFDGACKNNGWELWHTGAREGGCVIQLGIEVCTVPSERYDHGSVLFNDGCLYVYGGYSQRCEDYCDDLWFFDIYLKSWREVYSAGQLTKFYTDVFFEETIKLNATDVPVTNTSSKFAGPGKRWRHSMVAGKPFVDVDGVTKQRMAIFGGHRLWHGYSQENSQANNWSNYTTRPRGGYMDDLWVYTKWLDFSFPGQGYKTNNGRWEIKNPEEQCFSDPGLAWDERRNSYCTTVKPSGRAGHGSAIDDRRSIIWIFGGYSTYYPYLSTDGIGSGPGPTSVGSGGFVPYPGFDYFRNDLWYFNLTSLLWIQVQLPSDSPVPDPRMEMVFLLLGDVIFMHGGYSDNYIYSDTWYFNITSTRWLRKESFVRPIYPESCSDDFEYSRSNDCVELVWPKHLDRSTEEPFDILDFSNQAGYWPDQVWYPYFGIKDKGYWSDANHTKDIRRQAPTGTALYPYAATGLRQTARNYSYPYNDTHNAYVYEYCTSVYGEPTRGKVLDGLFGRSDKAVLIAQPRPQRPGWDGCRDRRDLRTDLPPGLQFVQPLARYGHHAVFHENTSEILFYGGMAYSEDQPIAKRLENTFASSVRSDMWYYHLNHCVNNCTGHGDCVFGFCYCYVGYYGIDCSNVSCPGTYCHYDPLSHEQICTHACQAGYTHVDTDTYVQDITKIPCSSEHVGESNGICDGFGHTMCAPPYITEDCSVKDCPSNCSFNGWCSVEFPVSRCMCQPGFYGDICDKKLCLNNCSYPNGICNTTTGLCNCNMMYSPYNNQREFKPWGGDDCSYLFAYAAASTPRTVLLAFLAMVIAFALLAQADQEWEARTLVAPALVTKLAAAGEEHGGGGSAL